MSERTALEIADKLDELASIMRTHNAPTVPKLYEYGKKATDMLRQQHAEIERLEADAKSVNSCAKNLAIAMHMRHFSHITQWEPLPDTIGLITQIDNMSCWPDVSREAAIASAVAAEREACAAACRRRSESAGLSGSASSGSLQCERDIRARSST